MRHAFVEREAGPYSDKTKRKIWNLVYEHDDNLRQILQQTADAEYEKSQNALASNITISNANDLSSLSRDTSNDVTDRKNLNKYWDKAFAATDGKYNGHTKQYYWNLGVKLYYGDDYRWLEYKEGEDLLFETPDTVIDNMKLKYYLDMWSNKNTLLERLSPGGAYNLKSEAPAMRRIYQNDLNGVTSLAELYSSNYQHPNTDPSEMNTYVYHQTNNLIYAKLISKAAIQNMNQKLLSLCKRAYIEKPILIGSMIQRHNESPDVGTNLIPRFKDSDKSHDSELYLAELLTGALDGIKEPTIEYFNIAERLFNACSTLVKLGATFTDIGLFFNQPVVREALHKVALNPRLSLGKALNDALMEMSGGNKPQKSRSNLEQNTLFASIISYNGGYKTKSNQLSIQSQDVINNQALVVETLQELLGVSKDLSKIISKSRQDSANSVGSDVGHIEHQIRSSKVIEQELKSEIFKVKFELNDNEENISLFPNGNLYNEDSSINYDILDFILQSPFGIPQVLTEAMKVFYEGTKNEFYFNQPVCTAGKDALSEFMAEKVAPVELLSAFNSDFSIYILQRLVSTENHKIAPEFNPNYPVPIIVPNTDPSAPAGSTTTRTIPIYEFMEYFFANYAEYMLKNEPDVKNYLIFDSIDVIKSKNGKYLKFKDITYNLGDLKDLVRESFAAALQSPNANVRNFARLLFFYNFHTKGTGSFGRNVCNQYVGTTAKLLIEGYIDAFNRINNLQIEDNGNILCEGFVVGNMSEYLQLLFVNRKELSYQISKNIYSKEEELLKDIKSNKEAFNKINSLDTNESNANLELTLPLDSSLITFKECYTYEDLDGTSHEEWFCKVAPVITIKTGGKNRTYVLDRTNINENLYTAQNKFIAVEKTVLNRYSNEESVDKDEEFSINVSYKLVATSVYDSKVSNIRLDYRPIEINTYDSKYSEVTKNNTAEDLSKRDDFLDKASRSGLDTTDVFTYIDSYLSDSATPTPLKNFYNSLTDCGKRAFRLLLAKESMNIIQEVDKYGAMPKARLVGYSIDAIEQNLENNIVQTDENTGIQETYTQTLEREIQNILDTQNLC